VLGLGNDILTDDAAGLRIARELRLRFAGREGLQISETSEMGLALLDFMTGYDGVILVDSIQTGRAEPGFVHEFDPESLARTAGRSPHFLGVADTLAAGRALGLAMPDRIHIFAVEVADPFTLATRMSPLLETELPRIVRKIADFVDRFVAPQ
jgi:hydrogenase maturation protease